MGTTSELLTLEYEHLKEEQRLRISTRDNLVYTTLGALALVIAGAIETRSPIMLLLLPPVCLVLGWTYLTNDDRITAIGLHIQKTITPELVRLGDLSTEVFSWEPHHRLDRRRRSRKTLQLAIDLVLYCLTAIVALIITWIHTPHSTGLALLVLLETGITSILAFHFIRNAIEVHI